MRIQPETFTHLQNRVIQNMSLLLDKRVYSPLVGKIFSLLLFASEPLSLQEMSERLKVSKAAVSIQVRTMEREGMCHKIPYRNDRRDYYYISEEFCLTIIRTELTKVKEIKNSLDETLLSLRAFANIEPGEQDSYAVFQRRYTELSSFYNLVAKSLKSMEEEWALEQA